MPFRPLAIFALILMPQSLWADEVHVEQSLDAASFASYVTGKTVTYSKAGPDAGKPFGAEEYLPENRVRWSFSEGQCEDGYWFEENDHICFLYENQTVPQCWSFYIRDNALVAHFENEATYSDLIEIGQNTTALFCQGPKVGV